MMERELTRVIRRIATALHRKQFPNVTKFTDEELKFGGWWELAQIAYKELNKIDEERANGQGTNVSSNDRRHGTTQQQIPLAG